MSGNDGSFGDGESGRWARAKELYFNYDGSGFYMSRDGSDREYREYDVPTQLEAEWRRELTEDKIAKLAEPANWRSVHYLCHHNDTDFLEEVIRAEPLGELWQRVSFVESMLGYVAQCRGRYRRRQIRHGLRAVLARATAIDFVNVPAEELEGREEMLRARVQKVIDITTFQLSRIRLIRKVFARIGLAGHRV